MKKVAVLILFLSVVLVLGGMALTTFLIPGEVHAAPQATISPKVPVQESSGTDILETLLPQTTSGENIAEGQAMVIIQLAAPPLATVFQTTLQTTHSLNDAIAAVRAERTTLSALQQSLIAQLTAAPFNARVISATSMTSNTLIVEVDLNLLEQIKALPGVLNVSVDTIGQLDSTSDAPLSHGPRPQTGPVLD